MTQNIFFQNPGFEGGGIFKESRYFPGYNFPTTGVPWSLKPYFKGMFSSLQGSVVQVTKFH